MQLKALGMGSVPARSPSSFPTQIGGGGSGSRQQVVQSDNAIITTNGETPAVPPPGGGGGGGTAGLPQLSTSPQGPLSAVT